MARWLLNHDPCKRPNSTEILQSQYIPPPKLKDTELHEMVRNTLSNSKSKNYKHLIASCFNQVNRQFLLLLIIVIIYFNKNLMRVKKNC